MAVVFDATVGGASANSYATLAEYNQYRENHGLATVLAAVGEPALIVATSWVDSFYRSRWNTQSRVATTQALHWPQSGATLYDGTAISTTAIPTQVKEAVYEYAISRSNASQTTLAPSEGSNTKRQKLEGVGELEYFSAKSGYGLPDDFKFIDTILIGLISQASGLQQLDLYRY